MDLHVATFGHGPDVVVLSGGPGCANYLATDELAPRVPHDFWATHPEVWTSIISRACR